MTPPFLGLAGNLVLATGADRVQRAGRAIVGHRPQAATPFGDDRTTLVALLQYQRDSFARKVAGLDEHQARSSPVPSGTSLLWLVRHLGRAEAIWVLHRFAGFDVEPDLLDDELQPDDALPGLLALLPTGVVARRRGRRGQRAGRRVRPRGRGAQPRPALGARPPRRGNGAPRRPRRHPPRAASTARSAGRAAARRPTASSTVARGTPRTGLRRSVRGSERPRSDRGFDAAEAGRRDRLVVPQVGEQVAAHRGARRVVPAVDPLQRVVGEVVQLALGAVVDRARAGRRCTPSRRG